MPVIHGQHENALADAASTDDRGRLRLAPSTSNGQLPLCIYRDRSGLLGSQRFCCSHNDQLGRLRAPFLFGLAGGRPSSGSVPPLVGRKGSGLNPGQNASIHVVEAMGSIASAFAGRGIEALMPAGRKPAVFGHWARIMARAKAVSGVAGGARGMADEEQLATSVPTRICSPTKQCFRSVPRAVLSCPFYGVTPDRARRGGRGAGGRGRRSPRGPTDRVPHGGCPSGERAAAAGGGGRAG